MSTTWIAEEHVVFVYPNGTRRPGRIAIGAPVQRESDCACDVLLEGLEPQLAIFGESTLQALLLGARFLGMRLHDFRSRGGRVVHPHDGTEAAGTDEDAALEAVFGAYLTSPK